MKYKFRKLKEHLIKKPYHRYGYMIEKFNDKGYVTYEHHGTQRKVAFIMKKLGCVQIGKPMFYMTCDVIEGGLIPNLVGLWLWKKHGEERWLGRIWEKKTNQIKLQKDREYRDMIREQTKKIRHNHIIFYEER